MTDEELHELADKQMAMGEVRGTPAPDPVNEPMIRHWLTAMGDANPAYLDNGLAPPAMAQVWTMRAGGKDRSPVDDMMAALNAAGYTGVVATNCEQTYHRYARVGERLTPATRFSGLAGPKRTALGVGLFATWNVTWYDEDDDPVSEMLFRVLKFRPPPKTTSADQQTPYPLRPATNQDTAFFWEGVQAGELRIQTCADCGHLRHPPGPLCPQCRSANRRHTVASGEGTVYSYVVHHHPPVPGRETPFVVAVVELPEGVRIVGNVVDCPIEEVGIGMALRVTYRAMDDQLVLPMWAPRES
ncbi:bifunctional MaoC family dehydratase N-terminal/OB-fold nucleic acid binding domain-containing protein [Nonomuraea sp. NPDC046802]|uniref:bifunctional MaoC family dehydratase N-terminal/OB-fold nucleic acid binding domain-containing protein n=1 Tax=Nonomuraea sp. NPDC046802 TaxID=3154919 RepID=UPI0033C41D2F